MISSRGAIVLSTFNRFELFQGCLNSIFAADENSEILKIFVLQGYYRESLDIIRQFQDCKTTVICVEGFYKSPLENIMKNYMMAIEMAFDDFQCDWILELEDDTIIAEDALLFIDQVYRKFERDRYFRGINLSTTNDEKLFNNSFSKLRTSFHGHAGVIPKRTWEKINKSSLRKKLNKYPFDWCVEPYWKTGYTVTPNVSRCMNFGWIQGTHASNDPDQEIFKKLRKSWDSWEKQNNFVSLDIKHFWNHPVPLFNTRHSKSYAFKYFVSKLTNTDAYRSLYLNMRNFKRFILRRQRLKP